MDTANQQQQTRVRKRAPNAYEDSSINSLARLLNPLLIRMPPQLQPLSPAEDQMFRQCPLRAVYQEESILQF